MCTIHSIHARQIIDSRGNPTVEVDVTTDQGIVGRASAPSGASTGKYEAVELRDNNPELFLGRSVLKAVSNVNDKIAPQLKGLDVMQQAMIDHTMLRLDNTKHKEHLGANAILAVSLAVARAAANSLGLPLYAYIGGINARRLPIPLMNILNGGMHADNKIDFQEFMIVPINAPCFSEALRQGTEVFHHLKAVLKKKGYTTNIGDEGGFAPEMKSNEEAVETLLEAIHKAGYNVGQDMAIALDAATSEMYDVKTKSYIFNKSSGNMMTAEEMVMYWCDWINQYPIVSIEDAMAEDDFAGWSMLTDKIGSKVQLVGDDLFVTNEERLMMGIKKKMGNSILIKVNQIGTLTETLNVVALAKKYAYTTIMSHRSGETEDTTIADLAVALNCGQIKTGSSSRTDRMAKYNQLLRIEEALGEASQYDNIFTIRKESKSF